MRPPRPANWEDLIAGYCAATGRSPSEAAALLEACDWNLRTALDVGAPPAGRTSKYLCISSLEFENFTQLPKPILPTPERQLFPCNNHM